MSRPKPERDYFLALPTSLTRKADQRALEIFNHQSLSGKRFEECLGEIYMIAMMAGLETAIEHSEKKNV